MPIYEYKCPRRHVSEKFYPTIPETPVDEIPCEKCGQPACRIQSETSFKEDLFFGSEYGFAAPGDRDSWHKNLDVQQWVGDEKRAPDRKPRARARSKNSKALRKAA